MTREEIANLLAKSEYADTSIVYCAASKTYTIEALMFVSDTEIDAYIKENNIIVVDAT